MAVYIRARAEKGPAAAGLPSLAAASDPPSSVARRPPCPPMSHHALTEEKRSLEAAAVHTPSAGMSQSSHEHPDKPLPTTTELDYSDHERIRKVQRRMMFKMDVQVVAAAFACYFLSFLDRSNIGQARLNGLQGPDGPLKNQQDYLTATACTYVLYIILEIPSNLVFKVATPRIWIPLLLTTWGLVSCLQGLAKSAGGFYVARLALGASEAGILPGLALWLTYFYRGDELMLRQSLYFSGATLSGAFSGLLSTVLARIHTSNYHGWSFIFFVRLICFFFFIFSP